jgi:16S rRNA (adenine1518-N6/adenine1519-N6)-dimethyltransferase
LPPLINYDSAQALRLFLEERRLGMRKKFGQNFLINPRIREKLLDALDIRAGDGVWEVGPGLGAMTAALLDRGAAVKAFEIDPGFIGILRELFQDNRRFTLIEGDALKTWRNTEQAAYLLGNLPYNIAAALLADFIEKGFLFKRMVVTVQREVARRMIAGPDSKDYSSFSVLCASVYTVTPLMVIKGASFYPAPQVDSQGVRFDIRADREGKKYPELFGPLVRRLFASRRKTVKNNLQDFVSSYTREPEGDFRAAAMDALDFCGIKPDCRAETLGIGDFAALAAFLSDRLYFSPEGCHDHS